MAIERDCHGGTRNPERDAAIAPIDAAKKVTHISVATITTAAFLCCGKRSGETWTSAPQWHRITLFSKLRKRLNKTTVGDLVRITGRIGQSKYMVEG